MSAPWLFGSVLIRGPLSRGGEETWAVLPSTCFQPPCNHRSPLYDDSERSPGSLEGSGRRLVSLKQEGDVGKGMQRVTVAHLAGGQGC